MTSSGYAGPLGIFSTVPLLVADTWMARKSGIQKLADYYSAEQYFEILYRPKHMEKSMVSGKRLRIF